MFNNYKQNKILPSLSALALINTAAFSGIVAGQSQATVEEIVVTLYRQHEFPPARAIIDEITPVD